MSGIEEIKREIAATQAFVQERFDPVRKDVEMVREEQERLGEQVRQLLEQQRQQQRESLQARSAGDRVRVRGGKLDGFDLVDLAVMRSLMEAQTRRPQDYDPRALQAWRESVTRAMDSTTAGAGGELVPKEEARQLWNDINVETSVASLFETVNMPTNPFDVPLQLGDVNWYPGTANLATTGTNLATAKQTLTAHELVGMVPWAYELDEDAVIAMMAEVRGTLLRNAAQVLDDVVLNADTSTTGNINQDGATLTSTTAGHAHFLLGFDGLLHLPLVDNTTQANNHNAGVSDDMFNEIRSKLGKYGVRPSELAFVVDVGTFIRAQSIAELRTLDKLGPQATVLTGQLGAVEGVPVIVSEQMKKASSSGKLSSTASNNTTGRLLVVNRTQWRKGFRRDLLIETERDIQKRQNVMVVSMRMAFAERTGARATAAHTGLQYNITGL